MKTIIFGIDQYAELLFYNLKNDANYEIVAFTVDGKYMDRDNFCGLPVVNFENITSIYDPKEHGIFICVGYNKMNTIRKLKHREAKDKGYKILSYTHPTAIVQTENIGEGTIVFEGVVIGPFSQIGSGNVFYPKAHIAHHASIGNFNFFAISCAVAGNIFIEDHCFFGNNCTVKNNIHISSFSLIGAAAYLECDTDSPGGLYVPARSIKLPNRNSMDIDLTKS